MQLEAAPLLMGGTESCFLAAFSLPFIYPGADHTRARGINDRGQIVGFYDAAGVTHGFIATPVSGTE